ncbi:MAG: glycosyltransferase [Nitrospirae bacterium]|nr:glycosyltransferase [Nitrospirota bacterium]
MRRMYVSRQINRFRNIWPIDESASKSPEGWAGWPEGKRFALVLTHDVDTAKGLKKCKALAKIEEQLGFRSSFNFVAERYKTSPELRRYLVDKGFEVGVHGLYHDGKYFVSRDEFQRRAAKINQYLKEWDAVGYRSPSMQHNLDWHLDLNIEYDASTFDTDPFEPQPEGIGTIFPFWVSNYSDNKGYVELPYTLPQDFTLFVLLRDETIDAWKRKLDWIAGHGGMALIITHPDYMSFNGAATGLEEYPVEYYRQFLEYIKSRYHDRYWHALPKEIAEFWRKNYKNGNSATAISRKKPNVLMVVENYFPSDIRVKREAYTLKDQYNITVIALKRKTEKIFERLDGVNVIRIPEFPKLGLGKIQYIAEYFYLTFCSTIIFMSAFLFKRYKAIHVHNPPDTLFLIGLIGKIFLTKFVFDHHDLSPELYLTRFSGKKDFVHKILVLCEKFSCKLADAVICTNASYKQIAMERHGIEPKKIHIVRNDPVIDECFLEKINPDNQIEKNQKKVLLYIGSINPQDGVDVLLNSLHYLANDLNKKDFICYIVGEGDALQSVKKIAEELNLSDFVQFTGYIFDREKIKEYLALSDVCVEPAPDNELNRHSTFIKIMEYMGAGKPIVAFDLKETRYSADGTAILVPTGDIQGFAHAIKKLLEEFQTREELGRAGIERIKKELNWENASKNLKEAYKSLKV